MRAHQRRRLIGISFAHRIENGAVFGPCASERRLVAHFQPARPGEALHSIAHATAEKLVAGQARQFDMKIHADPVPFLARCVRITAVQHR